MTERPLSLADHVCLAIIAEGPTHGWALVKLLRPDGEIGRIWSLSRPLTYRSIDHLVEAGMVDRSDGGRRAELRATEPGRRAATSFLARPVGHIRDLRTEFLLKLELAHRAAVDPSDLINRQRDHLEPAFGALTSTAAADPVELWRQESARAAERFLDRIEEHLVSTR
jgi:DNA-binding PadR family transcriptional regulator